MFNWLILYIASHRMPDNDVFQFWWDNRVTYYEIYLSNEQKDIGYY